MKRFLLFFIFLIGLLPAYATHYYNIAFTGASDATVLSNWTTNGSGGAGTAPSAMNETGAIFEIRSNSAQTMYLGANVDIGANTFMVDASGVFDCRGFVLSGSGSTFTLSAGATLMIGNVNGITTSGATGNIQTGTRTYAGAATYIYDGSVNQVTGNGLPSIIGALMINNTGSSGNNIVSLTTSPLTLEAGNFGGASNTGVLTLTAGIFKIGTNNSVKFNNNSSGSQGITNNGGDLATTNGGADGGTVVLLTGSGAAFTINGTGVTHFYNFYYGGAAGTAVGSASRNVTVTNANSVIINDSLVWQDNNANWSSNAPIYGPNATLYLNNNGQGWSLATSHLVWCATSGYVIGTTPGYPNNVTVVNFGTSVTPVSGVNVGLNITSATAINGTLSTGDGTTAGVVGISNSGFFSGGITVNNNSKLAANVSFTVKGNWLRTGATIGTFTNTGVTAASNTITFAGSGTDNITVSSGTETSFFGLTVNGTSSLIVKLNSPVTLPVTAASVLTLTSGVVTTDATNILYVSNPVVAALSGGSTSSFINGPFKRATTASGAYLFPTGSGTTSSAYLPFTITNPTGAPVMTVTATMGDAGAAATFSAPITAISHTEYWQAVINSGSISAGTVKLGRQASLGALDLVAKSAAQAGSYSTLGGTSVNSPTGTITAVTSTGSSLGYFVMATDVTAPTITIDEVSVTQVANANVSPGSVNDTANVFRVNITGLAATLTSLSFTPGGTFIAGDLTNFKLYTSSSPVFSTATLVTGGTFPATASVGGTGTVSFTGLTQSCPIGATYFWITADVASGAGNGHTIIVPAISTTTFSLGTPTYSTSVGGTLTITVPSITLDNGAGPSIAQIGTGFMLKATNDNIIFDFRANITGAAAILNSLSFTATGSFTAGDFTNFHLYSNSTASLTGATLISTVPASLIGNPGFINFAGLNLSYPTGNTYFFITADVAAGAVTNHTITVPIPTVSFAAGAVTNSITTGNKQTIAVPTILLDNGSFPSVVQTTNSYILQSSTNNILSDFRALVSPGVPATLNTLSFTANGTFAAGDFTNFYLYANTTASTLAGATLLSTVPASLIANGATISFTGLTQPFAANTNSYFFITADVAAAAIPLNTIIASTPTLTFSSSVALTNSITAAGTKTIAILPTVATTGATSITTTSATLNGTVNANNVSTNVAFSWGSTTGYGNNPTGTPLTVTGSIVTNDSAKILSGLTPNTIYHYVISGTNGAGTATSLDATFTTLPNPPTVAAATLVVNTGFTANWAAPALLGNASYTYTLQISTSPTFATVLASQSGITGISYSVAGLSEATVYYYRVRTDNATGSSVWSTISSAVTTTYSLGGNCPATTGSGSPLSTSGIKFTTTAPVIDGLIDSVWGTAYTNDMNVTWFNTDNNKARWRSVFTRDSIYFLVEVNDNTLVNDSSQHGGTGINAIHPWDDDAIELTIDGGNEKTTSYDANDFQIRFNWGTTRANTLTGSGDPVLNNVGTAFPWASMDWIMDSTVGTPAYVPYGSGYTKGYMLEAAIPWNKISSGLSYDTGFVGRKVGVDFLIDDDDANGGNATTSLPGHDRYSGRGWYTNSTAAFNNPSVFGTTTAIACDVPVVINPTATNITATTATLGATVSVANGALTSGGSGSSYDITSAIVSQNAGGISGFTPTVGIPFTGPRTGFAPQTHYYYVGYATNQAGTANSIVDSFYTLSALPTTQAAFSTNAATCSQITLNWTSPTWPATSLATTGGYIILRRQDGVNPSSAGFINASTPASLIFPSGTTLLTTINGEGTLTYTDLTVVQGVSYTYAIIPFTWDNIHYQTYDYDTSLAPKTSATLDPNKIWLGATSMDWNTSSNWCGGVPDSTTDALIPTGAPRYPNLNTGAGAVKNITIQSAAAVTVSSTGILSIAGVISNSGTFDASTGTIRMAGTIAQVVDGNTFVNKTINNLIVSNTSVSVASTTSDTLKISGTLSFGNINSATFATGDNVTFTSTATATASVADITNNGNNTGNSITGKASVERYIQAHRAWRLLTAPISSAQTINASWQEGQTNTATSGAGQFFSPLGYGTEITNTTATSSSTGFDKAVTNNPSILYLNAAGSNWVTLANTNSTNVNSQQGFMIFIRGDRSVVVTPPTFNTATTTILRSKGTLNQGTQSIPIAGTNFRVIGNPYASGINFSTIHANNGSVSGDTYYLWDPLITSTLQGVGAFVTFVSSGPGKYASTTHTSPFDTTGRIESGSAFVMNFISTGSGTLSIPETAKNSGSALVFRPVNDEPEQSFRADLYTVSSNNTTDLDDGTLTLYNDGYSDSVSWQEDAKKLSNISENISLIRDGKLLAIEKRQPIVMNDTIFLNLTGLKQQAYQFAFAADNIDQPGLVARLEDKFLNAVTPVNLTDTTKVNFNVTADPASQGSGRFRIVFQTINSGPLPVTYTSVKAWQQNNGIAVQWNVTNQLNIKQYIVEKSTDGHTFIKEGTVAANGNNIPAISYNWIDDNTVKGYNYYRIMSISTTGEISYSQIVRVKIQAGSPEIAVYPNPIVNGAIGLQMMNMPKGKYGFRLIDNIGQVMLQKQIEHAEGSSGETISLDNNIAKGVYHLEITGPDNYKKDIKVVY